MTTRVDIHKRWYFSGWWIATGAVITALVVILSRVAVGRYFTAVEAQQLLLAMRDGTLFLSAAIATGSATIVALMLTLLGLGREGQTDFQHALHDRVRTIALLATLALLGAVLILVTMTIPVVESEEIQTASYRVIWWAFTGALAVVSGLFVSVVLTLHVTIIGALDVLRPDSAS